MPDAPAAEFEFAQVNGEGPVSLGEAIGQALGAASTCWETLEGTGTFDSTRANGIATALLEFIDEHRPERTLDRDLVRAKISDAYYDARNAGATMEAAADNAADAVMELARGES